MVAQGYTRNDWAGVEQTTSQMTLNAKCSNTRSCKYSTSQTGEIFHHGQKSTM